MVLGITTYISNVLSEGKPFAPSINFTSRTKGNGLKNGQLTDIIVRKVFLGEEKLSVNNPRHAYAVRLFECLHDEGITLDDVQIRLSHDQLPIRAIVDGVGHDQHNNDVVLEFKTTLRSVEAHKAAYNICCENAPMLTNNVENSEHNRHNLQCAFATLCWSKRELACKKRGVIIVACSNGVVAYDVPEYLIHERVFSGRVVSKPVSRRVKHAFLTWPGRNATELTVALRNLGYAKDRKRGDVYTIKSGPRSGILGIVNLHGRYSGSARERANIEQIRRISDKYNIPGVILFAASPRGGWKFWGVGQSAKNV